MTVSFMPQQKGHCEAVLELKFYDHKCKTDFLIRRTLSGWAKRSTSEVRRQQNGFARALRSRFIKCRGVHSSVSTNEERGGEELLDIGMSISDEEDIIEHGRPNDTFATATASLTSSRQF